MPARRDARRFPGKLLADLAGAPVLAWTLRACLDAADRPDGPERVVLATDDAELAELGERVASVAERRVSVVFDPTPRRTGSDRVAAACARLEASAAAATFVLDVQGDEAGLAADAIHAVCQARRTSEAPILTAAARRCGTPAEHAMPDRVKVVVDNAWRALYFSRAPIPATAATPPTAAPADDLAADALSSESAGESVAWLEHVGVYAFTRDALTQFTHAERGGLERRESLEQLRALAIGMTIDVVELADAGVAINRPDDIEPASVSLLDGTRPHPFAGLRNPVPISYPVGFDD